MAFSMPTSGYQRQQKRSVCESPGGCFGTQLGGIPEDQGREDWGFFFQATNSCHTVGYIYISPHILTDQFSGHIRSRIYIHIL